MHSRIIAPHENKDNDDQASAGQTDPYLGDLAPATASLAVDGARIVNRIVSHATTSAANVESILNGIQLQSNPNNLFGGNAFYVAEGGTAAPHVSSRGEKPTHVVALSLSSHTKMTTEPIFNFTANNAEEVRFQLNQFFTTRQHFAGTARQEGYEAIRYRSRLTVGNTHNIAIIQKPENLTPIGVYPPPPESGLSITAPSAFSIPTLRTIQAIGVVGTAYAAYEAVETVNSSKEPVGATMTQGVSIGMAIRGGMIGAAKAIRPCATLGMAFAPYTVPVCIAASSFLGGTAGVVGANAAYYAGGKINSIANALTTNNDTVDKITKETRFEKQLSQDKQLVCAAVNYQTGATVAKCSINLNNAVNAQLALLNAGAEKLKNNMEALQLVNQSNMVNAEQLKNNLPLLQHTPHASDNALTPYTSSTSSIMDTLKDLRYLQHTSHYLTSSHIDNFSPYTQASCPIHICNTKLDAEYCNNFYFGSLNMRFDVFHPVSNHYYSLFGGYNHDGGKSGGCDSRFQNCNFSSSIPNDCRSEGSKHCKSSRF